MTDTDRGIDPRYDPRFQRGYDGSGDGDASALAGSAGVAGSGVEAGRVRAGDAEPAAVRETAAEWIAELPGPDPSSDVDREPAAAPKQATESAKAAVPDPNPVPTTEAGRRAAHARVRNWLLAGWAVTGGAMLLGAWLGWRVNSDFSYYSGVVDQASENLRVLGWTLAPALLVIGAVGAVVVTGVAASLHDAVPSPVAVEAPGFRRAPAWWALPVIAVAAVVLIAWAVARAAEGNAAGSSLSFAVDGNVTDDQQAKMDTMALGQVAQMLIGPFASAAVAALVAIAVIEAGRAGRTARAAHR
ncbi:hypothetical protein [Agromyces italicus]|uniref:hypothetical protein n=1 Tax=Agromyces italicus TaxID=279572 RepID=UPI0004291A72|nr:hypothetical protein [Agromyces italicus]